MASRDLQDPGTSAGRQPWSRGGHTHELDNTACFKTGGRLIRMRGTRLQLAEGRLTRPLFWQIVARIAGLAWRPSGWRRG
jgi:hypothetical protein